jgi:hypothetical protein
VFGDKLPDGSTLPEQLALELGRHGQSCDVWNCGIQGAGLFLLEKYLPFFVAARPAGVLIFPPAVYRQPSLLLSDTQARVHENCRFVRSRLRLGPKKAYEWFLDRWHWKDLRRLESMVEALGRDVRVLLIVNRDGYPYYSDTWIERLGRLRGATPVVIAYREAPPWTVDWTDNHPSAERNSELACHVAAVLARPPSSNNRSSGDESSGPIRSGDNTRFMNALKGVVRPLLRGLFLHALPALTPRPQERDDQPSNIYPLY